MEIQYNTINMVFNWLFKRLFTPDRIKYLIKSNRETISETMKDSIQDVLEDEEIAKMMITTTDHIYNRYLGRSGKLWSTIGGVQKGVNFAVEGEIENMNPFSGLIDADGEISLSSLAKGFLKNAFRKNGGSQQTQQAQPGRSKVVPNM